MELMCFSYDLTWFQHIMARVIPADFITPYKPIIIILAMQFRVNEDRLVPYYSAIKLSAVKCFLLRRFSFISFMARNGVFSPCMVRSHELVSLSPLHQLICLDVTTNLVLFFFFSSSPASTRISLNNKHKKKW